MMPETFDENQPCAVAYRAVLNIRFGKGGNAEQYQLSGWSDPENGFTFSIGSRCALDLTEANIKLDCACMLEILVQPFTTKPRLPSQPLSVRMNGISLGHISLEERRRLGFLIPPQLCSNGIINFVFEHAGAQSPFELTGFRDTRILGFAFFEINIFSLSNFEHGRRLRQSQRVQIDHNYSKESAKYWVTDRYKINIEDLLLGFESLGDNCEFGLFQRSLGVEPLGLLRFSTVYLEPLIKGLESAFDQIGALENLQPKPENDDLEWMIYENKFKLRYHSFVRSDEMSEKDIKAREQKKLAFLRRKFLEDLAEGEKIFVYKRATLPPSTEEILPLFRALSPQKQNTLLVVVPATDGYPPGTVEEWLPGLLRGHIDYLAETGTPGRHSTNGWLEICIAAWRVVHG